MKNKIALGVVLGILLAVIVVFSGCIEEEKLHPETIYTGEVKVIPISGIDQDITISSDVPVKLVVSGMRNVITVPHNVTVIKIVMSGIDNTVYIPQFANPQLEIYGIRNEVVRYETSSLPEHPIVTPTQPTIPMPPTQYITGNNKVQDVSGDEIHITGNYNQIKILNADVSLIRVTGNYNTVYYPKDARPVIKETGNGNAIKTY